MAMLLALAASPEDVEVILISVTYGNIDVQNCLRNVVSLFHHIEKEIEWRKANGRPIGFEALTKSKPLVAIGPEHPLADQMLMADYFRESMLSIPWRCSLADYGNQTGQMVWEESQNL